MKFISFGDIHEKTEHYANIEQEVRSADLVLLTGDYTRFGGRKKVESIISPIRQWNNNVLGVIGNLDYAETLDYLLELGISLHGRGMEIDGIGFFGVSGGLITPVNTPFELSEGDIYNILMAGYNQVQNSEIKVIVSHSPPKDTQCDMAGQHQKHVGSESLRKFIEETQPQLCLCGHIHESAGKDTIGNTIIVNPGDFMAGGYTIGEITKEGVQVEIKKG